MATRQPHCIGPLLPCTPTTAEWRRPIASFAGKAEPAAPKPRTAGIPSVASHAALVALHAARRPAYTCRTSAVAQHGQALSHRPVAPQLVRASVRLGCRQAAVPIAGQETESATTSSSSPLSHSPLLLHPHPMHVTNADIGELGEEPT